MEATALVGLQRAFGYRYKRSTDAIFAALRAAGMGQTYYELAIADDAIANTGAQYLRASG